MTDSEIEIMNFDKSNYKKRPSEELVENVDPDPDPSNSKVSKQEKSLHPTTTKRRKKNGKSLDEFFEFFFVDKLKMGRCKICQLEKQEEVLVKMTSGNTSGIKRHLEKWHVAQYEEVYQLFPSQAEAFSQAQFNKKTVDWVVKKYLPYNFFDDNETQDYFKYINPLAKVPKRNELKSLIGKRFTDMQESVMHIMQYNKSKFSFTLDSWTSIAGRSYHDITIHFITDDWVLQSLVIDFCPSNGEHTGKDIASVFYKVVNNYRLEEKILGITVDNASANTKFMRELSCLTDFDFENQHFRCYAHILNLSAQDMLKELKLENSFIQEEDGNYT